MTIGFADPGTIYGTGSTPPASGFPAFLLSIQVAFNDNVWAVGPNWTDITDYATSVKTTMGRQHELQQVNPSTAQIVLRNETIGSNTGGRFSPWNTASPYYNSGNGLTPGHPVRIQATIGSTSYNVFYGYTQSWVPTYSGTGGFITLNCYDGMALVNLALLDQNLYDPQVIADGATAYWECQDPVNSRTFADATGNGNVGVLVGAGTFGGTAGALRAVGDGCVILGSSNSSTAGLMSTPITPAAVAHVMFEGWFQTSTDYQTLMSWAVGQTAGNVEAVSLCTNGSGLPVLATGSTAVVPPATQTLASGPKAVTDGNWHHYVVQVPCTDSTGTYTLWIDGALIGSGAGGSAFAWTSGGGGRSFTAGGYWYEDNSGGLGLVSQTPNLIGSMDHVAYYQTPLSSSQIANHYALGSAGFVTQDSGARTQVVLENLGGIPAALVNCDTGVVQLQGSTSALNQTTASSYLQQVMNSERGILYQDTSGVFQFKNRWHVYTNPTSTTSQFTFSYHGGGQHYYSTGLVPAEDDTDLWNDINVGRRGGTVQNASNTTSITKYGRRSLQGYTGLLFEYDSDAADLAGGLEYQYSTPSPRVRAISTSSIINNAAALPHVLALNLLDRITIVFNPIDGSSVDFSQQSLVEQITHTITPGQWDTTLAVTPIGTETFALWGTATWGGAAGWGF